MIKSFFGSSFANETFKLLTSENPGNGPGALSQNLTINDITVAPTFVYEAKNATTSTWTATVGEDLTGKNSGGTVGLATPFSNTTDKSVDPEATRHWDYSDNVFGDLTTEDIVSEIVIKTPPDTVIASPVGKWDATSGYLWYVLSNQLFFQIRTGAVAVSCAVTGIVADTWYHAIAFMDRSGSGVVYVNGVAGAALSLATVTDSLANANEPLTIGEASTAIYPYKGNICYTALWAKDAWLDTHLQANLAQERFYKLAGVYPELAKGTALPTSYTRATTAHLDKEVLGDNTVNQDVTTWSSVSLTPTESGVSPSGATAYILAEDATAAVQHYTQQLSLFTPEVGEVYECSVEFKAINRNWVFVSLYAAGENHSGRYVNLSDGTFGATTYGNTIWKKVDDLGSDWYRVTFRQIFDTSESKRILVYVAEADNDTSFDGLDQDSVYIANPIVKKVERKAFQVGSGWPRVCQRTDVSGSSVTGYLSETAGTNLITFSQDFHNAAWTKVRSAFSASAGTAPDGSNNAAILGEDGTAANTHVVYPSGFSATSGNTYTQSVFVKAANRQWVRIVFASNNSVFVGEVTNFDLTNGTIGTDTADSSGIEDWGDGWFRCWSTATAAATNTGFVFYYIAEADNDPTFDGLSQDSLYIWQADIVEDIDYPQSPIYTSGSTAARNADVLYYKGDDGNVANNQRGAMVCDALMPNCDFTGLSPRYLELSDGAGATDRIALYVNPTGDYPSIISSATGGNAGANASTTRDVFDNIKHTVRATWKPDSLKLYIDGTEHGTEDTSVDIPDDLDRINIGFYQGGSYNANGLISNVKIFNKPTTKG